MPGTVLYSTRYCVCDATRRADGPLGCCAVDHLLQLLIVYLDATYNVPFYTYATAATRRMYLLVQRTKGIRTFLAAHVRCLPLLLSPYRLATAQATCRCCACFNSGRMATAHCCSTKLRRIFLRRDIAFCCEDGRTGDLIAPTAALSRYPIFVPVSRAWRLLCGYRVADVQRSDSRVRWPQRISCLGTGILFGGVQFRRIAVLQRHYPSRLHLV